MSLSITDARAVAEDGAILHAPADNRSGCARWRANGRLQTWKRDTARFRLPVKHGLRAYDALTESSDLTPDTHVVARGATCPRCGQVEW